MGRARDARWRCDRRAEVVAPSHGGSTRSRLHGMVIQQFGSSAPRSHAPQRCEPGTPLRALPELDQDVVIARLLPRIWRVPPATHSFRLLSEMTAYWSAETRAQAEHWPDTALVREGLRLFEELPHSSSSHALLATDLHAGNVLRADRKPWLVIDPKPFVGDPAYDARLSIC